MLCVCVFCEKGWQEGRHTWDEARPWNCWHCRLRQLPRSHKKVIPFLSLLMCYCGWRWERKSKRGTEWRGAIARAPNRNSAPQNETKIYRSPNFTQPFCCGEQNTFRSSHEMTCGKNHYTITTTATTTTQVTALNSWNCFRWVFASSPTSSSSRFCVFVSFVIVVSVLETNDE